MGKTTRAKIAKGLCEVKDYEKIREIENMKQPTFLVKCPFCDGLATLRPTTELGKGVRCECGAMFFKGYCYFYKYRNAKKVEQPKEKERLLLIRVRCPDRGYYVSVPICKSCPMHIRITEDSQVSCGYKGRAR